MIDFSIDDIENQAASGPIMAFLEQEPCLNSRF